MFVFILLSAVQLLVDFPTSGGQRLSEQDRVQQWYDRATTWPPTWQPESIDFKAAMDLREAEILALSGSDERWENFMQFTQSRMLPRFTKLGFQVIQTPPDIQAQLKLAFDNALPNLDSLRDEASYAGAYRTQPTKLLDVSTIKDVIHSQMQPLHEAFVGGMALAPTVAYGVRVNRAGSSLAMHYDQVRFLLVKCDPHSCIVSPFIWNLLQLLYVLIGTHARDLLDRARRAQVRQ